MAKKKFYAVKKGKTTGIFMTWETCKASVDGYPGAEYKGFATQEEARHYLKGEIKQGHAVLEEQPKTDQVIAYVDGSFHEKLGRYAFGCVLLTPDGNIIKESGSGSNPDSLPLRNVTGEMLGAMYAVLWCVKHGYLAVDIRYDYAGIENWAVGAWKTNNSLTFKYAEFMKANAKKIQITYKKIAAHTGDQYNEEADQLAKAAIQEGKEIPEL